MTWKDIEGYETLYQVSSEGQVRSLDRDVPYKSSSKTLKGRTLKTRKINKSGHHAVFLCKRGKAKLRTVHSLVLEAFVGDRPKGKVSRHGPKGVDDNSVANLCYGSRSENQLDRRRDGTHSGKTVLRSDGEQFINMQVAAEETKCNRSHIGACCRNERKTAGGFKWSYLDGA